MSAGGGPSEARGVVLLVLALALFGSAAATGYEGFFSWLVTASAFFVLVVGVVEMRRGDGEP